MFYYVVYSFWVPLYIFSLVLRLFLLLLLLCAQTLGSMLIEVALKKINKNVNLSSSFVHRGSRENVYSCGKDRQSYDRPEQVVFR